MSRDKFASVRLDIPGFTPSHIVTAGADTPHDVSAMIAVRVSVDSEYYINTDVANKAVMPARSVTVIGKQVDSFTFTNATVLEVMDRAGV
jgi:hypothetical protein